jgi:hypothetical protein
MIITNMRDAVTVLERREICMSQNDDTISRQAAIEAIDNCECDGEDSCGHPWIYKENAVEAIEMVEPLPTAEPKRGKWKNIVDGIEYSWGNCDTCGARIPMAYKYYEYCPHCGVKMEVTK